MPLTNYKCAANKTAILGELCRWPEEYGTWGPGPEMLQDWKDYTYRGYKARGQDGYHSRVGQCFRLARSSK